MSEIDLEGVCVTFNPRSPLEMKALRPTRLSIPNGQFVSVIGSNGAGKSTLLGLIAGDIRPDSGTIRISNEDVTRQTTFQRARKIGRVFQDPLAGTCGDLTILENLAIAQSRYAPQRMRLAISRGLRELCADRVGVLGIGLENRLDDVVKLLSGGQRQALSLVMATLHTPDLLLLDEHTAALDPGMADFLMSMTEKIVRSQSVTTLMVTHSMRQAVEFGDRTLMLHRGQILMDISGDERASVTVEDLLSRFKRHHSDGMSEDNLLLN